MRTRRCGILAALLFLLLTPALAELPPDELPTELLPSVTPGPQVEQTPAPVDSPWLSDGGILRLVNREKKITKDYVPVDLVVPRVGTRKRGMEKGIMLREEAARALEAMFAAAKREAGHTLFAVSGYRSYGIQQILFNGKVEAVGSRAAAERTVSPPGASEHQLGLAMDVQSPSQLNLNRSFGETEEGKWTAANAHRFGFILRYKAEWREITGYAYEPWHFRYVGLAHARAIHALDIPYEHYVAAVESLPEYVLRGATDYLLVALAKDAAQAAQLASAAQDEQASALRAATLPHLPEGASYESVLWEIYPTPKPTAGPRVDPDEDSALFLSGSP